MELGSLQSRLKMLRGLSPQNDNLISRTMKKRAVRVVWAGGGDPCGTDAAVGLLLLPLVFHSASSSGFKEHWEEPSTRSRTLVVVVVVGSLPGTEQTNKRVTGRTVSSPWDGRTDGRTDGVSLETAPHRPASVVPILL